MEILGLTSAGSSSGSRVAMAAFVEAVLGLSRAASTGSRPTCSTCATALGSPLPPPAAWAPSAPTASSWPIWTPRSRSFVPPRSRRTTKIAENAEYRYVHFRAPDGGVYELVERRAGSPQR
jgi:hypothetical protein